MTTGHHGDSPLATWLTHTFAGIFLGLLVAVVMAMLHNVSPFPALERAGADAAQRMFAFATRHETGRPAVALIGLERAELDEIVSKSGEASFERRMQQILDAGPAQVILDLQVPDDVPDEREAMLVGVLDRLAQRHPTIPIVVSIPWRTAAEGHIAGTIAGLPVRAPNLLMGASLFEPDADAVVRQVRASLCRTDPSGGWTEVPHIAAPQAAPGAGKPESDDHRCTPSREIPILFFAGPELLAPEGSSGTGPLRYIQPGSAPSPDLLAGATVVLGAVGSAALSDRMRTPLGIMDSVLVAANAALTLADPDYVAHAGGHGPGWVAPLLWVIGTLITFAMLAPMAGTAHWRRITVVLASVALPPLIAWLITLSTGHPPDYPALLVKLGAIVIAASIFSLHSLAAFGTPPLRMPRGLWRLVLFLLAAAGAVLGVLMFNLFLAEWLLPLGWRIGSLLPAFAVMLEAVAEGLKPVSGAIHQAVERRMAPRPRPRPLLLLPLLALPPSAAVLHAARAAGGHASACEVSADTRRITVETAMGGRAEAIESVLISRRGGEAAPLGGCRFVEPGDVLLMSHGVRIWVPYDARKAELGPLILIVQPRPYRGGAGALARFQAALGEAVLPPTISPRLPVQAALSLPTGKKAPVAP